MIQNKCKFCKNPFTVDGDELVFLDRVSPSFNGHKFPIPAPALCPLCRQQLRMSFRNERKLYKGKSAFSGKEIISMFAPEHGYKVIDRDEWWSDQFDPLTYGQDFDFNKTFAEQFRELYMKVPHLYMQNTNTENSYYTNYALNQKNSYLIFGASNNEDCLYGKFVTYCANCIDTLSCHMCELCYEGIACERCYNCRYMMNSRSCNDCTVIEDCTGCRNCIACFGLKFKERYFLNKQYSKEEFEKIEKEYAILTPEKIAYLSQELEKLKLALPHPHAHIYASDNCTGELVSNCKECHFAFDSRESEDCKYIYFCPKTIHSMDCTFNAPVGPEFSYNLCSTVALKSSMCNFLFWYGDSVFYCMESHHANNSFGCVGLKHNDYCIFNKQYTKEEYESLVAKIVEHMMKTGEWGEYFSPQLSAFAYNETIAQEHFPLTKEQAIEKGWRWKDEEPQSMTQISKDPTTIICSKTSRPFKLMPAEIKFYTDHGIPTPTIHPDERHYERVSKHNTLTLFTRKCSNCEKEVQTIHAPESKYRILCEECYLKEIY